MIRLWFGAAEFGRPGIKPGDKKDETGHNSRGFTFWLAGAGREGRAHSRQKPIPRDSRAVEGKVHFRDLHATILHAMGLAPNDLKYWHAGREHRLTGPTRWQSCSRIVCLMWRPRKKSVARQIGSLSNVVSWVHIAVCLVFFGGTQIANAQQQLELSGAWKTNNEADVTFTVRGTAARNNPLRRELKAPFSGDELFVRFRLKIPRERD